MSGAAYVGSAYSGPVCPVCYINPVFDGRPCLSCSRRRAIAATGGGHKKACRASDLRKIEAARKRHGVTEPMSSEHRTGSRRWTTCSVCLGQIAQLS